MLLINNIKRKDHDLTNIYFIKLHYTCFDTSFLTRNMSSARIVLLPTVEIAPVANAVSAKLDISLLHAAVLPFCYVN